MLSQHVLAASLGQGWTQIGELLLAFGLSAVIGLERQFRHKSAGLRTQTIVGTSAALIVLVSKYGFSDVLAPRLVVLDPSRVAAQIVSGIGFLGAGLILTKRGTISGLTTAASVWGTAAIGMAAGAGLPVLALIVTALYLVIVVGLTTLIRHLPGQVGPGSQELRITYQDQRGVLRGLLTLCADQGWTVDGLSVDGSSRRRSFDDEDDEQDLPVVTVTVRLSGPSVAAAVGVLAAVDGVFAIDGASDDTDGD